MREIKIRLISRQAQMMIEYVLMFSMIVLVMIFAAMHFIRPSVNHMFEQTSNVINGIADDFVDGAYTWPETTDTEDDDGGGGEESFCGDSYCDPINEGCTSCPDDCGYCAA